MILENLKISPVSEEYIKGLSQDERIKLYDEIKTECDNKEKEFIANQAKLQQYEEELTKELDNIKTLGLNSEQELQTEISRLDNELTQKCLEYTQIINQ